MADPDVRLGLTGVERALLRQDSGVYTAATAAAAPREASLLGIVEALQDWARAREIGMWDPVRAALSLLFCRLQLRHRLRNRGMHRWRQPAARVEPLP